MEANKILNADILDIIFEGKNKEYGAYELRKTYPRRLLIALLAMVGIFAGMYLSSKLVAALTPEKEIKQLFVKDVELKDVQKQEKKKDLPKPPPPPPKPIEPPKVEMKKFVTPKIVEDEKVQEPPPTQEQLETVKVGTIDQKGIKDEGFVTPPEAVTTTKVEVPVVVEDYDKEYKTVQIQAQFPGGEAAWRKYLTRNLNNNLPGENGAPPARYTVVVSFLVNKEGVISEVKAENDPGYGVAEEAVRVIRRGPSWIPAEQNGRKVIYRQRQSIVFDVLDE